MFLYLRCYWKSFLYLRISFGFFETFCLGVHSNSLALRALPLIQKGEYILFTLYRIHNKKISTFEIPLPKNVKNSIFV